MQLDWFFTTGKSHHVCEDYAINGDKYIIVSDGCSSSKHTDLGSRLLAHSARIELNTPSQIWDYQGFGQTVIRQAAKLLGTLKMDYECLFATLIVARILPSGAINVRMYGDGVIIDISNGAIETTEVKYTNNMPYYLAYNLSTESMEAYQRFNNTMLITTYASDGNVTQQEADPTFGLDYTFYQSDKHTVIISTDGLSAFEDSQTRQNIPLVEIVRQVADFKAMKGEFLKRRLIRMIETLAVKKVFPTDDVGIAGINL